MDANHILQLDTNKYAAGGTRAEQLQPFDPEDQEAQPMGSYSYQNPVTAPLSYAPRPKKDHSNAASFPVGAQQQHYTSISANPSFTKIRPNQNGTRMSRYQTNVQSSPNTIATNNKAKRANLGVYGSLGPAKPRPGSAFVSSIP